MEKYEVRVASVQPFSVRQVGELVLTCETEPEAFHYMAFALRMNSLRGCTCKVVRVDTQGEPFPVWAYPRAA